MVAIYNARARAAELPPSKINAAVGDLFDKDNQNPAAFQDKEYQNFDLATVGFGFHHFEDVVHAARSLKERLRPGGVLVINDFLEGGDLKADENGNPIEGSQGDHTGHIHHHHHSDHKPNREGHQHQHPDQLHHGHGHDHSHHHSHDEQNPNSAIIDLMAAKSDEDDPTKKVRKEMNASVVVPSFTIDGVKKFFTEAGFVDVDVVLMEEKAYMEFAGRKLWRTVLFAKGRRPLGDGIKMEKSEL
jgi:SAM-dependent methyltransferase